MSPEQVRSARNVDERTDIWSLGIILYELLTGHAPFQGSPTAVAAAIVADATPPIVEFRDDIPEDLQATIYRALAKDPAERFANVLEFARALAPFGAALPASMASEPMSPGAWTPLASMPVASRPSLPSRPSHHSYPRAAEASVTLAAGPSLHAPANDAAVSVAEAPRAPPRKIVARFIALGGSFIVLSAVALMALHAHSGRTRSDAAPPVAVQAPLGAMAADPVSVAVIPPRPAPESAPADPGSQDARTAALATSPAAPAPKSGPASPAARVRPTVAAPPPSAATPPPAPPSPPPPPHGQSNPLFL
jgi:serine/threonine-protein kinase